MYKIPANTLFVGQSLVFMPECHSTNDEASRLIQRDDAMEGTLVITGHQMAGRGQRGNTWSSEAGKNLTFSVILKPTFLALGDQFYLNMIISLGVYDYLKTIFNEDVKIKWPNDILVKNKKVCGILIENQINGQKIQNSIIGVGLNVNQEKFDLERASSLKILYDQEFELQPILEGVLEKLESRYLMLREQLTEKLSSEYQHALYWLGETRVFSSRQKLFEGKIAGVDEFGRMKIETDTGIKYMSIKEVEFVR